MDSINRPTKEQVRSWLAQRRQGSQPLPDFEQIRRQLGWDYCGPDMCLPTHPEPQERKS